MSIPVIVRVDGESFRLNIKDLTEEGTFVDKYAERTESFDLEREIVGLFINYKLTLGDMQEHDEINKFMRKIREVTPFHTVELPFDDGTLTFQAYITGVSRRLKKYGATNQWGGFEVKFISKSPQFRA